MPVTKKQPKTTPKKPKSAPKKKKNGVPARRVLNNPATQGAINADYTNVNAFTRTVLDPFKNESCDMAVGMSGMRIPRSLEYLGSLVNPREFPGSRVPDPFVRETTATYPAKVTINVTGVNGAAVNATPNAGRFCYVIQPWISETAAGFAAAQARFQVASQDGTKATALWTNAFAAPVAGTNFFAYAADPETSLFANASSSGLMEKVRPVSASILASYNGNLVNGGGNIAAALVPGGAWLSHLQTAALTGHRYMLWEDLARHPGAYDGPLSKGAYAYWLPDDESDLLFRPVETSAGDNTDVHQYPVLIVSGQVAPDSNGNFTGGNVLRLDIYINYEYTTDSRIVECRHGSRDVTERHKAIATLSNQPTSMENEGHIDWVKTLIAGACGFVVGGPIGAAVGIAGSVGVGALSPLLKSSLIKM
jgi:hypothetical protein